MRIDKLLNKNKAMGIIMNPAKDVALIKSDTSARIRYFNFILVNFIDYSFNHLKAYLIPQ